MGTECDNLLPANRLRSDIYFGLSPSLPAQKANLGTTQVVLSYRDRLTLTKPTETDI